MMERLNATEKLLNQTRKLAEEQLTEADRAYKAAAESLTVVESLRLPNIDPQQVRISGFHIIRASEFVYY